MNWISGSISIDVCQSEDLLRRNKQKIYDINRLSYILYIQKSSFLASLSAKKN